MPEEMPLSAWPGRERTTLLLNQVRFGMWERVRDTPQPQQWERGPGDPGGHAFAQVVWRYAQGMAAAQAAQQTKHGLSASSAAAHRQQAEQHLASLVEVAKEAPRDLQTQPGQGVGIYSAGYEDHAAILQRVAAARLAALGGDWQAAVRQLEEAVALEDGGGYFEPPRQHIPVRHCLGWALLKSGLLEQAAAVYRADLLRHPVNGWSLLGLSQALSGRSQEGAAAQKRFAAAWAHADQPIHSSCPSFGK